MRVVVEDYFAAHESAGNYKRLSEGQGLRGKLLDTEELRYGGGSDAALLLISGNRADLGRILNANHELYQLLGYRKDEVLGQNVAMLMPGLLGRVHNRLIQGYFEEAANSAKLLQNDRFHCALDIHGILIPCNLLVRTVSNLSRGIQFIGFLNREQNLSKVRLGDDSAMESETVLLMTDNEMKVSGFNYTFAKMLSADLNSLNVFKYHESEQKLDLSTFYPDLFSPENYALMTDSNGLTVTIDLDPLITAFESLVLDAEKEPDEAQEQDSQLTPPSRQHLGHEYNVKLKHYQYGSIVDYNVLTMMFTRKMEEEVRIRNKRREDIERSSRKDEDDAMALIADTHSVSTSSASRTQDRWQV